MAFADIQHRFDRENHAGFYYGAFAGFSEVHDMWVFVKVLAYAVAAEFSDHRIAIGFSVFLNGVANVAQCRAGFDLLNTQEHRFTGDFYQSFGVRGDVSDAKHFASVAMITVLDDGDVDIDDVAVFQLLFAGDAVANLLVDRGAYRFREAAVIQWCWNRLLFIDDVVVTKLVEVVGRDAGNDVGGNHF